MIHPIMTKSIRFLAALLLSGGMTTLFSRKILRGRASISTTVGLCTKGDAPGVGSSLTWPRIFARGFCRRPMPHEDKFLARPSLEPAVDIAFAQPEFEGCGLAKVESPHDWGIEGPFKQEYPGETANRHGGAWRGIGSISPAGKRRWQANRARSGRRDGLRERLAQRQTRRGLARMVMPRGNSISRHFVKVGGENVLAIRLDNPKDSSRWYPGGGIYRNVWLTKTAPVHVGQWGVLVTTPEVSKEAALIQVPKQVWKTN